MFHSKTFLGRAATFRNPVGNLATALSKRAVPMALLFSVLIAPCALALPDLLVESISILPASPAPGEDIRIEVTITNAGDAEAAGSIQSEVFLNDESLLTHNSILLLPGQSLTFDFGSNAPGTPGPFEIRCDVDVPDLIIENDESNNSRTEIFGGGESLPDLVVESITCTPDPANPGENITVEVTVTNMGDAEAACEALCDIETEVYLDGELLGSFSFNDLSAGESVVRDGLFDAPDTPGAYTLSCQTDTTDVVAESDEANNSAEITCEVSGAGTFPDLVVESIISTPDPAA